jgi:hypothetical protein
MNNWYKGWDVHSYTNLINTPEIKEMLKRVNYHLTQPRAYELFQEIRDHYTDEKINQVLMKMLSRCYLMGNNAFGYIDPDIQINVISLLHCTWQNVKIQNEQSLFKLMKETLLDIGQTCIQGDSHRLIMLLIALNQ